MKHHDILHGDAYACAFPLAVSLIIRFPEVFHLGSGEDAEAVNYSHREYESALVVMIDTIAYLHCLLNLTECV